jgi:hypothetical protein
LASIASQARIEREREPHAVLGQAGPRQGRRLARHRVQVERLMLGLAPQEQRTHALDHADRPLACLHDVGEDVFQRTLRTRQSFQGSAPGLGIRQDRGQGLVEFMDQRGAQFAEQADARQVNQLLALDPQFALEAPLGRQLLDGGKAAVTPAGRLAIGPVPGPARCSHTDATAWQRLRYP